MAISVSDPGSLMLTGASIADPRDIRHPPNPGDTQFASGSGVGGDAFGLELGGLSSGQIFAAYGTGILASTDALNFLNITYTGEGTINATGLVAMGGGLVNGLTASISIVPEPTTAAYGLLALCAIGLHYRQR